MPALTQQGRGGLLEGRACRREVGGCWGQGEGEGMIVDKKEGKDGVGRGKRSKRE